MADTDFGCRCCARHSVVKTRVHVVGAWPGPSAEHEECAKVSAAGTATVMILATFCARMIPASPGRGTMVV